ncbi:hypothetical protein BPT24_182 [Tenacibaculum phage pT24]|uniref:Uncharacterized protein n=1 Tax=Tenacibaculum phage pT24 TaxID=1880590 RepID=A0A1B4XWY9_9CAUD|nr:hypothetical protein HYP10_gp182 [Tenacibaculum phage pT24]BAV39307.1 hypothetical protein BPT24_182 [Tenacibaculum phage pT24]
MEKIVNVVKDFLNTDSEGLTPKESKLSASSLPSESLKTTSSYDSKNEAELPRGAEKSVLPSGEVKNENIEALPHSLFSDYHLFRAKTVKGDNYPLFNTDKKDLKDTLYREMTPEYLINNPIGASIYKPMDFIYLERLRKVPLNRMITLRRFAFPIVDDIFSITPENDEPDIARMITFSDQENNKISDLMSFSTGMRWKELESTMEEMQMHGPRAGVGGYMSDVMKFIDPTFGQDRLRGDVALSFDPMHDSNKVYGMVDSISSTHIRDVGLNFEQEFTLTFNYKMRSFNGINGKAAFLDLISHILMCVTNDAKFWGGARFWKGRRPTKYIKNLKFLSPTSFNDFLNKAHVEFKGFLGKGSGNNRQDALNLLKNVATNVFNMGFGKLLDKIGRPAIPYTNSLLTSNPVGNWHVTIGNPHNPSMTIGNLLLTNTVIKFGDVLGHDDFPEDIIVECTLKHAMPRGKAEIEQMFQGGRGRMYWKPKDVFGSMSSTEPYYNDSGRRIPSRVKTLQERQTFTEYQNMYKGDLKFGQFDKASVLRNANEVWSFNKVKK